MTSLQTSSLPVSTAKRALGLLREVQRLILEEPKRLDMGTVCYRRTSAPRARDYPSCGTVGCIAGWVNVLKGYERPSDMNEAARTLGLNARQQKALFMPESLVSEARAGLRQSSAHAIKTFKHIDRFIKRNLGTLRYKKV